MKKSFYANEIVRILTKIRNMCDDEEKYYEITRKIIDSEERWLLSWRKGKALKKIKKDRMREIYEKTFLWELENEN